MFDLGTGMSRERNVRKMEVASRKRGLPSSRDEAGAAASANPDLLVFSQYSLGIEKQLKHVKHTCLVELFRHGA